MLDVLVNNAGVFLVEHSRTEEGFEVVQGTNYFGTFLLTHLLLDTLKDTAQKQGHARCPLHSPSLHAPEGHQPWWRACLTFFRLQCCRSMLWRSMFASVQRPTDWATVDCCGMQRQYSPAEFYYTGPMLVIGTEQAVTATAVAHEHAARRHRLKSDSRRQCRGCKADFCMQDRDHGVSV